MSENKEENAIDTVFSSAYLVSNLKHDVKILYGNVEEDHSNRFNLGCNVSTSQVIKIDNHIFTTKNSTYLVKKIDEIEVCERDFMLILKGVHPNDAGFISAISEQENYIKH
jgi:hypothetical protein